MIAKFKNSMEKNEDKVHTHTHKTPRNQNEKSKETQGRHNKIKGKKIKHRHPVSNKLEFQRKRTEKMEWSKFQRKNIRQLPRTER